MSEAEREREATTNGTSVQAASREGQTTTAKQRKLLIGSLSQLARGRTAHDDLRTPGRG